MAKLHKDPLNEQLRDIGRAEDKSVSEDISAADARERMINRIYHKDEDDDIEWITVNGTHVPLKDGKAIGGPFKGKTFETAVPETPKVQENKRLTAAKQSAKMKSSKKRYAAQSYGGGYGNNGNGSRSNSGGYKRPHNPKSKIRSYSKATTISEAEAEIKPYSAKVDYRLFNSVETARRVNDVLLSIQDIYPFVVDNIEVKLFLGKKDERPLAESCWEGLNIYFDCSEDEDSYVKSCSVLTDEMYVQSRNNIIKAKQIIKEAKKDYDYYSRAARESQGKLADSLNVYADRAKAQLEYAKNALAFSEDNFNFTRKFAMIEGQEIEGTITHEVGHILADQIFGQANPKHFNKSIAKTIEQRREAQQRRDYVDSIYHYALNSGDIYNISQYAKVSSIEFFAECFSMYTTGQELPDYITTMIIEVLS